MRKPFRPGAIARWLSMGGLVLLLSVAARDARAGGHWLSWLGHDDGPGCVEGAQIEEAPGTWYWLRSPDDERRTVAGYFNRYCLRCHGADGRGVWDMPDIPNFTDAVWQSSRSDGQLARIILEGRGAVMPPFRGTLSLDEAWAMARYLRTFAQEPASRPDQRKKAPARDGAAPARPEAEGLPLPRPFPAGPSGRAD